MISFCIPSRNPHKILATIDNIREREENSSEILITTDDDINVQSEDTIIVKEPRGRGYFDLWERVNRLAVMSSGDWIWNYGDDITIQTPNFDTIINAIEIPNDGILMCLVKKKDGSLADEIPLVTRRFVGIMGGISPCHHGDTFLNSVFGQLKRIVKVDVIIKHSRCPRWGGNSRQSMKKNVGQYNQKHTTEAINKLKSYMS